MNKHQFEPLLREDQVALALDRSISSLRQDRNHGRGIPFLKIGKSVRYRPSAVREYLESCEDKGTAI